MTARPVPTQATITRCIKAARAAGVELSEVRLEPDGTVRVLIAGQHRAPDEKANPWDEVL